MALQYYKGQKSPGGIGLKCHKMPVMSHFDKTVMNVGYYYHEGFTNRHMDQESKCCGN